MLLAFRAAVKCLCELASHWQHDQDISNEIFYMTCHSEWICADPRFVRGFCCFPCSWNWALRTLVTFVFERKLRASSIRIKQKEIEYRIKYSQTYYVYVLLPMIIGKCECMMSNIVFIYSQNICAASLFKWDKAVLKHRADVGKHSKIIFIF